MIKIKPLKTEDCNEAARIEAECLAEAWSAESLSKLCKSGDAAVLAAYDADAEKAVGLVHCGFVLDEAHINNVSVAEEYRRQGIGSMLLCALFDEAKKRGCTVVFLEVRSSNMPAVTLYKKLGFTVLGEQIGAYHTTDGSRITGHENALVMGKKLI